MSAMSLFLASLICSALAALASLLLQFAGTQTRLGNQQECTASYKTSYKASRISSSILGFIAALFALGCGIQGLIESQSIHLASPYSFAPFELLINPLSALLLIVLAILSLAAWLFGYKYMDEYKAYNLASFGFFMNIFIMSMNLVILADNVFWFLIFFELMSLSSYFLVCIEQSERSKKAAFLYLIMAHVGLVLIMLGFLLLAHQAHSLSFQDIRNTSFSPLLASSVFVLGFIGFGIKAGMIPFHSWLPLAHPAAPSQVSALMSGGMIKIGIFGIIKLSLDLLGASQIQIWWGALVLLAGAISAVLGVIYALVEHDIKRLLAYHSVENIGIILMGLGVALLACSMQVMSLFALALVACLFHLLNHALFKGLLFLGAGSISFATHTKNLELLGGLSKRMPITALCFFIGAVSISALPPFNGFASEWLSYQSLFSAAMISNSWIKVVCVFTIVALALTGALALTCFVKAYGVSFAGEARSKNAQEAQEVSLGMRVAMLFLSALCVVFGLGAPWALQIFNKVSESCIAALQTHGVFGAQASLDTFGSATSISLVNPLNPAYSSTLAVAVLLALSILGFFLIKKLLSKGGAQQKQEAWACGYASDESMPVRATNFATGVESFYSAFYALREHLASYASYAKQAFNATDKAARDLEPLADIHLVDKTVSLTSMASKKLQKLASGDFRSYTLYIVLALIAFIVLVIVV